MSMTQIEQIKAAHSAYILLLNPESRSKTQRYAVYLQIDAKPLQILWPSDSYRGEKSVELLPGQVRIPWDEKTRQYPAFQFIFQENFFCMDVEGEIANTLKEINPKLDVYRMRGWSPSPVR